MKYDIISSYGISKAKKNLPPTKLELNVEQWTEAIRERLLGVEAIHFIEARVINANFNYPEGPLRITRQFVEIRVDEDRFRTTEEDFDFGVIHNAVKTIAFQLSGNFAEH